MDSKNVADHTALVPADAVSEAAKLLRELLIALHSITVPLHVTPTIEATNEEPAPPTSLPPEQASMSGLRRPHKQRPATPTGAPSEEEDEEGAVGDMV